MEELIERDRVQHQLNRELEAKLFDYDITVQEYKALWLAHDRTPSQVANGLGVTQAQITALAKCLFDHKYVTYKQNPKDRRSYSFVVTKKGKDLLERIG